MKKFLVGALATFMCLGCLTACDMNALLGVTSGSSSQTSQNSSVSGGNQNSSVGGGNQNSSVGGGNQNSSSTQTGYNLDAAKAYVRGLYKDENVTTSKDYRVANVVTVGEVPYTIQWSVNVTAGVTLEIDGNETVVNVDEMTENDIEYVLTAKIIAPDNTNISVGFNRTLVALSEEIFAAIDKAPVENVAYKLHTFQQTEQQDCYFTGSMGDGNSKYYFATSTDMAKAVDIYVEYVAGSTTEFYPYFVKDGVNQYIGMRVSSDGKHDNIVFDTAPVSVFVWNDTIQTITTTITDRDGNQTEFYLGNYDTHMTISGSAMSHAKDATTNIAQLKIMLNRTDVSDAYKVEETKKNINFSGLTFVTSGSFELPTAGTTYPDVAIEWAIVEGTCAVKSGNTVTVTAGETTATATLKATFKVNNKSTTKEFTITAVPNNAAAIVAAAYALPTGQQFATNATLTGVITSVDKAYDAVEYHDITVTMTVANKAIKCYCLAGNGADVIARGYTITVSGVIKNFNGTIEFDRGCFLESYVEGEAPAAPAGAVEYVFSEYTAGTQYAENEEHVLDETVTVISDGGHFTKQLRLYDSSSNDATAIIESTKIVNAISVKAGHNDATLNIYGSVDGSTWTLIESVSVVSSFNSYDVTISNSQYKYLKLDASGDQVRVESMTLTFAS